MSDSTTLRARSPSQSNPTALTRCHARLNTKMETPLGSLHPCRAGNGGTAPHKSLWFDPDFRLHYHLPLRQGEAARLLRRRTPGDTLCTPPRNNDTTYHNPSVPSGMRSGRKEER